MPGTGKKRSGRRVLTVGTDCAVGKKYTALAIEKEMRARGVDADFRATGQTGIFISGRGIAVDSVVSDFVSGAAEWLSPAAAPQHWDVIEGQGSLFHPAYAGVTLGLIHGSQPDALVLCHDLARTGIADYEGYAIPSYEACFEAYLAAARLTNPAARFAGVSLNTSSLDEAAAAVRSPKSPRASRCPAATRSATASQPSSTGSSSRAERGRNIPAARAVSSHQPGSDTMNILVDALIEWPRRVARHLEWLGPLFARLVTGWVFLWTGWGKLTHLPLVTENFAGWGIPAPQSSRHSSRASSSSAASCCSPDC